MKDDLEDRRIHRSLIERFKDWWYWRGAWRCFLGVCLALSPLLALMTLAYAIAKFYVEAAEEFVRMLDRQLDKVEKD